MMSPAPKEKILKMVEGLPDEMLDKLLALISQLKEKAEPATEDGRFSGLCGSISREDVAIMRRAIEEREKVDLNAW